ncbi:MAG: hypothetical protein J6X49_00960 [Victivallales bacterium]|nr:hypothetical protein [Victivallales bacterium]
MSNSPIAATKIRFSPRGTYFVARCQNGWNVLVAEEWSDFAPFHDLDAWMKEPSSETVKDTPCRIIIKTSTPNGVIYTKYMRAQNDGVIKKHEIFPKLKWTLAPSRAQRILKTTDAMRALGHPCPAPLLGARKRGAFGYPTEIFIASEITLPTAEDDFYKRSEQDRPELIRLCGRRLAALHRDGFIHGDFLPRNVCPDWKNDTIFYLDNDRTKQHAIPMPFFLKRRNLAQFSFNLYLLAEQPVEPLIAELVGAYAAELEWSDKRRTTETAVITRQVNLRWEKHKTGELSRKHLQSKQL